MNVADRRSALVADRLVVALQESEADVIAAVLRLFDVAWQGLWTCGPIFRRGFRETQMRKEQIRRVELQRGRKVNATEKTEENQKIEIRDQRSELEFESQRVGATLTESGQARISSIGPCDGDRESRIA